MLIQMQYLRGYFLVKEFVRGIIGMAIADVGVMQMKGKSHADLADLYEQIYLPYIPRIIKLPIR